MRHYIFHTVDKEGGDVHEVIARLSEHQRAKQKEEGQ